MTALGHGLTRYVTEAGDLVESDGTTPYPPAGRPGVIEGVLASSSVPMVCPPRLLGPEAYCDGGVLQNVPLEVALSLGADDVVAVLAVPLSPPERDHDLPSLDLLTVHLRAQELQFYGVQFANLTVPVPEGTHLTVIAPTLDLVGAFEVEQGLLLVDMDYGWMRAADVFADIDEEARARAVLGSDAITVARESAWYLEERLWSSAPLDVPVLEDVLVRKREVRRLIGERVRSGVPVPDAGDAWWQGWETHSTPPPAWLPVDPWAGRPPL